MDFVGRKQRYVGMVTKPPVLGGIGNLGGEGGGGGGGGVNTWPVHFDLQRETKLSGLTPVAI